MRWFTESKQGKATQKGVWLAALALTLVFAAAAAQAVVIQGRGVLSAAGNGFAVVELRGALHASGIGLAVVEEDAIVDLQGHGRVTRIGEGRVLLEGFGAIAIRSLDDRTRVELGGARLRLRAKGIGRAFLKGVGTFMTDDVDGGWDPDAEVLFESEE